jgi:hypothetical protein
MAAFLHATLQRIGSPVGINNVTAICNAIRFVTIILLRLVLQQQSRYDLNYDYVRNNNPGWKEKHAPRLIFVGNRIKPGKSYK